MGIDYDLTNANMQAVTPVPQEVTTGRSNVMSATKVLFGKSNLESDSLLKGIQLFINYQDAF